MTPAPAEAQRSMHIVWVVDGVEGSEQLGYRSNLASNRYRAILPAQALREKGHRVTFASAKGWQWHSEGVPDAVVIGKLLAGRDVARYREVSERVLKQVEAAVRAGTPVIADFNDDHFDHPMMGGYWRQLAGLASVCVAGSDAMAELLARQTQRPTSVVGDPIASPSGVPRVFGAGNGLQRLVKRLFAGGRQQRLKLAWYGNTVNWPAMQRWAQELVPLSQTQPYVLWIVTSPTEAVQSFVRAFNAQHAPAALAELIEWDEQTQWDVVRDADIVLLPSEPGDPKMSVKTSNRLVDALNMGRAVVASPLPSYQAFANNVKLTDDPLEGVRWWLAHRDEEAAARLQQGQGAARALAGMGVTCDVWEKVITAACGVATRRFDGNAPVAASGEVAVPERALVRLNLGCGDKILPGYVNVDVVEARAGRSPDVLCDLHDLSVFPDNHADEIMAIHVVEHFWRWEVEDILREWMRVLKPGGRMILECPNLVSACEEFLKNPDIYSREGKDGQRTMWVFYGDPSWKDPYMIHRWGYTPTSLKNLMESIGLVGVRQEAAQYKLREPRDMRVTGIKTNEC